MDNALSKEDIRIILGDMLNSCDMKTHIGRDAEKMLCYVAGLRDMANAIIDKIERKTK